MFNREGIDWELLCECREFRWFDRTKGVVKLIAKGTFEDGRHIHGNEARSVARYDSERGWEVRSAGGNRHNAKDKTNASD